MFIAIHLQISSTEGTFALQMNLFFFIIIFIIIFFILFFIIVYSFGINTHSILLKL